MVTQEDLVLVVERRVPGAHVAIRVVGLFLLNVAGSIEVAVIAVMG